jgi:hypothetical protein
MESNLPRVVGRGGRAKPRPHPLSFSSRDASVSSLSDSCGGRSPKLNRQGSSSAGGGRVVTSPRSPAAGGGGGGCNSRSPSRSPCRSPIMMSPTAGGGLAYLASRRSSVTSTCPSSPGGGGGTSAGGPRSGRRQSNFLELPG